MLLVVDVGNTNTVLGLYEGKELVHSFRIESSKGRTVDEYHVLLLNLISLAGVERERITASIVASVVPALSDPTWWSGRASRRACPSSTKTRVKWAPTASSTPSRHSRP
jgi:type III pantothenate kinase